MRDNAQSRVGGGVCGDHERERRSANQEFPRGSWVESARVSPDRSARAARPGKVYTTFHMAAGGGLGRFRWTYTSPAILERFPEALGEHDKKITTFDIDKANGTPPKINGDALVASAPPLCNICTASHSSDLGILAALTGCDTKSVDKQSDKQQATLCNDSMRLRGAGGESTDDLAALGRLSNNDNELFFPIMRKVHYIHQRR